MTVSRIVETHLTERVVDALALAALLAGWGEAGELGWRCLGGFSSVSCLFAMDMLESHGEWVVEVSRLAGAPQP